MTPTPTLPVVNTRITVTKYRDEPRNDTGTIVEVRDTQVKPIKLKTYRATRHKPGARYLVTVRCDSGQVKSFYLKYLAYTVLDLPAEEKMKLSLIGKLAKWLREN